MYKFLILTILVLFNFHYLLAQEPEDSLDFDKQREDLIQKLELSNIPDPNEIEKTAKLIFSKKLHEQSKEELTTLAKTSNKFANFIGFIEDEYDSYRRSSYRYDFITDKIDPILIKYQERQGVFLRIRNQAYLNLGMKAKNDGQLIDALLYFRDAFRLSEFSCREGTDKCIRLKAEEEMKKLLKIEGITSYTHWK